MSNWERRRDEEESRSKVRFAERSGRHLASLLTLAGICLGAPAASSNPAAASQPSAPSQSTNALSSSQAPGAKAGAKSETNRIADTLCALAGPVGSVLVQPDGGIVITGGGVIWFFSPTSGAFGTLSGTVTRFDSEGSLDPGFGCAATPPNYVNVFGNHLAAMKDGRLLMVGPFHTVDGQPRPGIAMLRPDGRLDSGFVPWRGESNAPAGPSLIGLRSAAVASDGTVWAQSLGTGPTGWRICQLEADGAVGEARRLGGDGANVPLPALFGQAGFDASAGRLEACFAQLPLELCRYAVRLPDGGAVLLVREGATGRLMRFDKDWQPDSSYTNSLRASGYLSLAMQGEGEILAARGSDLIDLTGTNPGSVVRLKRDGSVDKSFHCETDERVMCLVVQPDGCVIIGGFFRKVNGVDSPWLARLRPNGALDESFRRHFTTPREMFASRRVPVRAITGAGSTLAGSGAGAGRVPGSTADSEFVLILSLEVAGGGATVRFQGAPAQNYILQASDRLDGAEWTDVSTNQTDSSGIGHFRDESAPHAPARFYRVAGRR